jgi:hypothetical protein
MSEIKYCWYRTRGSEGIAVQVAQPEKLMQAVGASLWRQSKNGDLHLQKEEPGKGMLIYDGKELKSACDSCVNRLSQLTGGCQGCGSYKTLYTPKKDAPELSPYQETKSKLVSYLIEENAKRFTPSQLVPYSEFRRYYTSEDIIFDEKIIDVIKQHKRERAKEAAKTKLFKKTNCNSCIYGSGAKCKHTTPGYCRKNDGIYYREKEQAKNDILSRIPDREKMLRLSTLCGRTIRLHGRRYRIAWVEDEEKEQFRIIKDYAPWDFAHVSLDEIDEVMAYARKLVEAVNLSSFTEDEIREMAVIYETLRSNVYRITSIERYQKQHLFTAMLNTRDKQIDIEIHQSKKTYPYRYRNVNELFSTTATLFI